ncbi:DnaJ domain-containing protein [Marispirochaeta sp.]|uniref:J domain-containing protein n=1 Tax=Marispirochaeta sp. TaxID=2038653 RepID=UPI0029C8DF65|nr:DnaJ domain-containing protein [Marispirochaeta sp.]
MNYYEILGIDKNVSQAEIKSAYRKQSLKWHPDVNQNKSEATERFRDIYEAYSILSDPGKKLEYDKSLEDGIRYSYNEDRNYQERYRDAYEAFILEMYRLAYELTYQNIHYTKIKKELVKRGCPIHISEKIAIYVESNRKKEVRAAALKSILVAIGSFIVGIIIFAIAYAMGRFWIGGFLFFIIAIINLLKGIYYLVTGRVPIES